MKDFIDPSAPFFFFFAHQRSAVPLRSDPFLRLYLLSHELHAPRNVAHKMVL